VIDLDALSPARLAALAAVERERRARQNHTASASKRGGRATKSPKIEATPTPKRGLLSAEEKVLHRKAVQRKSHLKHKAAIQATNARWRSVNRDRSNAQTVHIS
jgi:hypothetical protein